MEDLLMVTILQAGLQGFPLLQMFPTKAWEHLQFHTK